MVLEQKKAHNFQIAPKNKQNWSKTSKLALESKFPTWSLQFLSKQA